MWKSLKNRQQRNVSLAEYPGMKLPVKSWKQEMMLTAFHLVIM